MPRKRSLTSQFYRVGRVSNNLRAALVNQAHMRSVSLGGGSMA